MYKNGSIENYLEDLAAKKPAPGGGSAAALEAATGCALMSMVANYTVGNKKYADVKEKAETLLGKSEGLRNKLEKLIDEDVRVYTKLSKGFKTLDKDSRELQDLYKESCAVPLEICKDAYNAIQLLKELVEYGNTNLITDVAISALMLESSFLGAKFNVYINLKYMKDQQYVEHLYGDLKKMEDRMPDLKEEILHKCEEHILK